MFLLQIWLFLSALNDASRKCFRNRFLVKERHRMMILETKKNKGFSWSLLTLQFSYRMKILDTERNDFTFFVLDTAFLAQNGNWICKTMGTISDAMRWFLVRSEWCKKKKIGVYFWCRKCSDFFPAIEAGSDSNAGNGETVLFCVSCWQNAFPRN